MKEIDKIINTIIIEFLNEHQMFENNIIWNKDKVAAEKINPPQYVYHISDKQNRNGILQHGLLLNVGDSYKAWAETDKAIPAIFATIGSDLNDITKGISKFPSDVWRIDTTKINNQWFVDKHFEILNDYGFKNPHIVTFTAIPRNAIDLIYKQK